MGTSSLNECDSEEPAEQSPSPRRSRTSASSRHGTARRSSLARSHVSATTPQPRTPKPLTRDVAKLESYTKVAWHALKDKLQNVLKHELEEIDKTTEKFTLAFAELPEESAMDIDPSLEGSLGEIGVVRA